MNVVKSGFAALALAFSLICPAHADAIEKKQVTLGVGGKAALYYLPLTLCERLGYFKQQGLDVAINDFRGGAQSLQALVGGSVDVVTGAYEHTIRMQAKGQDIRSVIELGRFPGIVLGVRKDKAASYKSAADLQGFKIGVTAPGSSTNFFVMYLMAKAGLKPTDASSYRSWRQRIGGCRHEERRHRCARQHRSDDDQARAGRRHQGGRRQPDGGGDPRHFRRLEPRRRALPET